MCPARNSARGPTYTIVGVLPFASIAESSDGVSFSDAAHGSDATANPTNPTNHIDPINLTHPTNPINLNVFTEDTACRSRRRHSRRWDRTVCA